MEKEIRTLQTEFRVVREGNNKTISGYAAKFNSDSENMGFIERIAPGAFKNALKRSDVRALWNHDANIILGRTKSGTLKLKEDKTGLHMEVNPPDTQLVRDMVMTPIERGDVTQQSFGFTVEKDEWANLDKDIPIRTIEKVSQLFDVSPVVYPAYPDTEVALRSLEAAKKLPKVIPSELDEEASRRNIMKLVSETKEMPTISRIRKDSDIEIKTGAIARIYSGENRIEEAIEDLRSLQGGDSAEETDLKVAEESDNGKDDLLERIQKLTEE